MAAGFLRKRRPDWIATSAGSEPADRVDPRVVESMADRGIDISEAVPARLTHEMVEAADAVVTMGCGDACPVLPGTLYEDWALPDPADLTSAEIGRVRDEIEQRVEQLVRGLQEGSESTSHSR